jgi:hypothetical protein
MQTTRLQISRSYIARFTVACVATIGLLVASPQVSQAQDPQGGGAQASSGLRNTAVAMTADAMGIYAFCTAQATDAEALRGLAPTAQQALCDTPDARKVLAFVERPTDQVPSRAELDRALGRIDSVLVTSDSLGGGEKSLPGMGRMMSGGSSGSGLNAVAWGLTDFVIARARDELTVSALLRLRSELEDHELKPLFAQTLVALQAVDQVNVALILPTLRNGFRNDLRALPMTMVDPALRWNKPEPAEAVAFVSALGQLVQTYRVGQLTYTSALAALPEPNPRWSTNGRRALAAMRLALEEQAACKALPDAPMTTCLADVVRTPRRAAVFARFLTQQVQVRYRRDFGDDVIPAAGELLTTDALIRFGGEVERVVSIVQGAAADSAPRRMDFARAVLAVALEVTPPRELTLRRQLEAADGIADAIAREDYPDVALRVLGLLGNPSLTPTLPAADSATLARLRRGLLFGSSLVAASSSADVQQVLESFADPVGSFRQRRLAGTRSVALVAYPGFQAGVERAQGANGNADAGHFGIGLPIGIEWRCGSDSFLLPGVFVGFLDLGVLASYRLTPTDASDSEISGDPDVTLGHIFSPSLMLTFAPTPKTPLMIGIGYQYAPRLRELTTTAAPVSAHRVSVLLAVDVTLFTFWRAWSP